MQKPDPKDFKTRLEYVIAFMAYRRWLLAQPKEQEL